MTNSKKDTFLPETENWLQTRKANEQKLREAGVWNASFSKPFNREPVEGNGHG